MADMKRILERWDSYLIFEEDTLSKLKDSPAAVEELADDIAAITDRKRLQAILNALAADPQIMQAVKNLQQLNGESKKEVDEGLSDEFLKLSTKAYLGMQNFLNSEVGKKTMAIAPPVLALAVIAAQLSGQGGLTPEDVRGISTILKTTGQSSVEGALAVIDQAAGAAITEKKWSF